MSVLIKGMEMPTNCCECPLTYYEDGTCIFTGIEALSIGIQKGCPLVPVPERGRGMIFEKLKYAEDGVFQCWSCENCVGHTEHKMQVLDIVSQRWLITFCLPECRVADKYMLYTTKVPCEKYRCALHADKEEEYGTRSD